MTAPSSFLKRREQRKYESQLAALEGILQPGETVSLLARAEIWTVRPTLTGVAALTGDRFLLSLAAGSQRVLTGYRFDAIGVLKVRGPVASLLPAKLAVTVSTEMCGRLAELVAEAGGSVLD
jgi:hypothetical protein